MAVIRLDLNAIQNEWFPSMPREEVIEKTQKNMSAGEGGWQLSTTVLSECQLVAWIAQNFNQQFPAVQLIPYVTCSKLHCFGCYTWLSSFNSLAHSGLPSIF
jgi:hypothetical protein